MSESSLGRWRGLGLAYLAQFGLDDDANFKKGIRSLFRERVFQTYWDAFRERLFGDESPAEIARKIGVVRSTVSRWKNDESTPDFEKFALCLAAFDFDFGNDTHFPRGAVATIMAYQSVIAAIANQVGEEEARNIGEHEVLYMFWACRHAGWSHAMERKDTSLLERAAVDVHSHVEDTLPGCKRLSAADIQMTQHKYRIPWSILEAVLTHEWFV